MQSQDVRLKYPFGTALNESGLGDLEGVSRATLDFVYIRLV